MGASQSAEKRVIPVNERRRLGAHPSTNRTRRYGNPVIMKNMVKKSIGNTRRTIQRRPSGNLSTNRTRRYGRPVVKNMVKKSIGNTRLTTQRRPSGNYAPLNIENIGTFRYELNTKGNPVRIPTDYNSNNNSINEGRLRKLV